MTFALKLSSCLSPALQNLLLSKGMISLDDSEREFSEHYMEFETFEIENLKAIKELHISEGFIILEQENESQFNFDTKSTKPRYYECCVELLSPTFLQSQSLFATINKKKFIEIYQDDFLWTKSFEVFVEVYELLALNDTSYDLLALLSLCVTLERALGNLFLLKGFQVPTMLKDLLTTSELFAILGYFPIQILQIVIGPPISMNLRNVAWHGFLAEDELPQRYIYFLLLLTASIGKHLKDRGISADTIVQRSYVSLDVVDTIGAHFEELMVEDFNQAEQSIFASWIVNDSNKNFFKAAFKLFRNGKHGYSSVMLFPLLEHSLRRLFVQVNECPFRLITAETTEFFTTFEEILENTLNTGQPNKIVFSLGEPCMDLLHDLLVYPAGPRARDKLSHGEADYKCVNTYLPKILIAILAWLGREAIMAKMFKQKLEKSFDSYRSKFHPIALLQQKVIDLAFQCPTLLDQITLSPSLQPWNSTQGYNAFTSDGSCMVKLMSAITNFAATITVKTSEEQAKFKENLSSPFSSDVQTVKALMSSMKITTLYRWKASSASSSASSSCTVCENKGVEKSERPTSAKSFHIVAESEVIGLLMRIVEEAHTSINQTSEALKLRCRQLAHKELRSRQRENLRRLLLFAPCAGLLINYVVCLSAWILSNLDSYSDVSQEEGRALQKQLKSSLQSMENIRTYTASDKNKWSEAGELLLSEITLACDKCKKHTYFQNI